MLFGNETENSLSSQLIIQISVFRFIPLPVFAHVFIFSFSSSDIIFQQTHSPLICYFPWVLTCCCSSCMISVWWWMFMCVQVCAYKWSCRDVCHLNTRWVPEWTKTFSVFLPLLASCHADNSVFIWYWAICLHFTRMQRNAVWSLKLLTAKSVSRNCLPISLNQGFSNSDTV